MDQDLAKVAKDGTKRFPCRQCGAQLSFSPGADALKCEHCGFLNPIPQSADQIEELDFVSWLEIAQQDSAAEESQTVKCDACAAQFSLSGTIVSSSCPFCGSNVVVPVPKEVRLRPRAVLPFAIDQKRCRDIYGRWISSRFWAPNALKHYARADHGIQGIYIPYWTFDSKTTTWYSGMRGDTYYETETYTEYENGQAVTRTRQVPKTHWTPVSGTVWRDFDDVLTPAAQTLPNQHVVRLESWDLPNLVPLQDEYLSGFLTERYTVPLDLGFSNAKNIMDGVIRSDVCADIGGDQQQVHEQKTQYDALTFKHILVPLWMGAYKFRDKTYRFLINGRTGEISGDAPVSGWKVFFAVLLGLIVVVILATLFKSKG